MKVHEVFVQALLAGCSRSAFPTIWHKLVCLWLLQRIQTFFIFQPQLLWYHSALEPPNVGFRAHWYVFMKCSMWRWYQTYQGAVCFVVSVSASAHTCTFNHTPGLPLLHQLMTVFNVNPELGRKCILCRAGTWGEEAVLHRATGTTNYAFDGKVTGPDMRGV